MTASPLLGIALLAALCGLCQWSAWRFNLPSILFLLLAGVLVGPVTGAFDPDALLGDLLFPFVSVAVAIILFEGGLTLEREDIQGHGSVVTRLVTLGVLLTWVLLATTVHFVFDTSWSVALVFGSIAVVSGPTVVKPLLRTVRPTDKVGHILHWEGILIDPIGVFLALLVFEAVVQTGGQPGASLNWLAIALILGKLIVVGAILGVASGWASAYLLHRYLVPDFLKSVTVLAIVIVVFALSETIQHESGLLAVTIMGIWLANTKGLHVHDILHFKENLVLLLLSALFVILAARLDLSLLPQYGWQILLLLAIAQFMVRPLNAWLCTLRSDLSWKERAFIGWIAPRGIVAAAVSSLFAIRLESEGIPGAELLVPLTFSLIIGTVVFQSLSARRIADRLQISNPEPNGVLFFGANPVSLGLGELLRNQGIQVLFADTVWRRVREARHEGFLAYHGNPTSGHAEANLDMQGVGKFIAMTDNREANALAIIHYRDQLGSNAVFALGGDKADDDSFDRFDTASRHRANALFDTGLRYNALARRLRDAEIVVVELQARDEPESDSDKSTADETEAQNDKDTRSETSGEQGQVPASAPKMRAQAPMPLPEAADKVEITVAQAGQTIAETLIGEGSAEIKSETESDSDAEPQPLDPNALRDDDLRLFALDKSGKLFVYGTGESFSPKQGWTVVALREPVAETQAVDEVAAQV